MSKKYVIITMITVLLSIAFVWYMYSKNYIVLESEGISIVFPHTPDEEYTEKNFEQPNIETESVGRVEEVKPSNTNNKSAVVQPRFFDDMMKFIETFIPVIIVLIPLYLNKRNKNKIRTADA